MTTSPTAFDLLIEFILAEFTRPVGKRRVEHRCTAASADRRIRRTNRLPANVKHPEAPITQPVHLDAQKVDGRQWNCYLNQSKNRTVNQLKLSSASN
jgi:hypothetical protein